MILTQEKHVLKLETIQRIATKMVPHLEDVTYNKRLKKMQLTILKERGDLIILVVMVQKLMVSAQPLTMYG